MIFNPQPIPDRIQDVDWTLIDDELNDVALLVQQQGREWVYGWDEQAFSDALTAHPHAYDWALMAVSLHQRISRLSADDGTFSAAQVAATRELRGLRRDLCGAMGALYRLRGGGTLAEVIESRRGA